MKVTLGKSFLTIEMKSESPNILTNFLLSLSTTCIAKYECNSVTCSEVSFLTWSLSILGLKESSNKIDLIQSMELETKKSKLAKKCNDGGEFGLYREESRLVMRSVWELANWEDLWEGWQFPCKRSSLTFDKSHRVRLTVVSLWFFVRGFPSPNHSMQCVEANSGHQMASPIKYRRRI